MDPFLLRTLAQLSISILGFSGIATALGNLGENRRYVSIRTKGLMYASSIAFFASLAPLAGLDAIYVGPPLAVAVLISSGSCLLASNKLGTRSPLVIPVHLVMFASAVWLSWSLVSGADDLEVAYVATVCLLLVASVILFFRLVLSIVEGKK